MGRACRSSTSTRTTTGARQTGFFETCSTMPAGTHGAAIMLMRSCQAPPCGLVDTNKTVHDGHFSLETIILLLAIVKRHIDTVLQSKPYLHIGLRTTRIRPPWALDFGIFKTPLDFGLQGFDLLGLWTSEVP